MKLKDIMRPKVPSATRTESAALAWDRLHGEKVDHLVVIQGDDIVGTLSVRDLSGPGGGAHRRMGRTVGDLMHEKLVLATPGKTVAWAARTMRKERVTCLPVIERGKLVGIVTMDEMLGVLARRA